MTTSELINTPIFDLEWEWLSQDELTSVLKVLNRIADDPFESSSDVCRNLHISKAQLVKHYATIQRSVVCQKILESSFPRYYSFFRERILSEAFWNQLFKGLNPFPLEIEIHPSEFCNLRCDFCPTLGNDYKDDPYFNDLKWRMGKGGELMEKINGIFREVSKAGTKRVIFSGGKEPTLAPHILDLIRGAKTAGLHVKVTTNGSGFSIPHELSGTIVSGEELIQFYSTHLNRIHLSLNAHSRELFNKLKGLSPGSHVFDIIVSNVRKIVECRDALRKMGRDTVEIYAAVLVEKSNCTVLPDIINFLSGLGVDIISINRYQYQMVGREEGFQDEEHASVVRTLEELESKWTSTKTRLVISFDDFNDRHYRRILSTQARCWIASTETAFNPVFLGCACDTAAFPGRGKIGRADYTVGFLLDHPNFKSYWDSNVEKRKNIDSEKCTDCRVAHKLTNVYVDKIYDDFLNGIALEDQPFHSAIKAI